jgi:hypothetical protein
MKFQNYFNPLYGIIFMKFQNYFNPFLEYILFKSSVQSHCQYIPWLFIKALQFPCINSLKSLYETISLPSPSFFTVNTLYRIFLALLLYFLVFLKFYGYEINPDIRFGPYLLSCKSDMESLLITFVTYYRNFANIYPVLNSETKKLFTFPYRTRKSLITG